MLYPEGQISLTGQLQPLKRGAGLVAVEMRSPVVPVKISGTDRVLPLGRAVPRPGPVTVRFGAPLHFGAHESYVDATARIEAALRQL